MLAALVTTDSRAGTRAEQLAAIGGEPDRVYVIEEVHDYLGEILRDDTDDVVAISHPRVLGDKAKAERLVETIYKAGAIIQGYPDPFAFMEAHRQSKWGVGTRKQKGRGRGRPAILEPTEDDLFHILKDWWTPRNADNPNGAGLSDVLAYASGRLGRKVTAANVKYWAKQKVGHQSRKGVDWRDVFPDRVKRVTAKPKSELEAE